MDEVFKSDFHHQAHTDEFSHILTQPTEDLILNRNAELRKNKGAIRDLGKGQDGGSWGRQLASIPMVIFEKAKRDGFDLNCKDAKIAEKEMRRFLSTDIGKACLV